MGAKLEWIKEDHFCETGSGNLRYWEVAAGTGSRVSSHTARL